MDVILKQFSSLWEQAIEIWLAGGWGMVAIALNAAVMFALGIHVQLTLRGKGFQSVSEKTWRQWIDNESMRKGPIGQMIHFVTGGRSLKDLSVYFNELRSSEIVPFDRDLRVMKVCISTAPLLGLLGTVTGMLTTFGALASGSGGEKTMGLIAKGISEALITTETGLVIALPGLLFHHQLVRQHDQYKSFLAHLETVCTQKFYKQSRNQG